MDWASASSDALPAVSFSHPHLQEVALGWAQSQGATVARPAKVSGVRLDGAGPAVTVVQNGRALTNEFSDRRQAYHAVLRAYDQWCAVLEAEEGDEADRRRELHATAREADPALGGFATLESRGPDGLNPDEAARRIYFGEPAD